MKVEMIALTRFLGGQGSPDELLELAGRVCYRSMPHGDAGTFVMKRVREGHESIIEHASVSFLVSGISRACSHQLVRHRIASYSQESQRYVELSEPEFIVPPDIDANPAARAIWEEHLAGVAHTYDRLRKLGIHKEDSRFLLPNATVTRLVVTMNFRSLRHFFDVRCPREAQWEIRELALEMLRQMAEVSPAVFGDQYERFIGPLPEVQ